MKMPQIAAMLETGECVWYGSLHTFLRANNNFPDQFEPIDRRALCRELRDGMNTPHGRPEPAVLGSKFPLVYISLVE
jgi:hypothetical protein